MEGLDSEEEDEAKGEEREEGLDSEAEEEASEESSESSSLGEVLRRRPFQDRLSRGESGILLPRRLPAGAELAPERVVDLERIGQPMPADFTGEARLRPIDLDEDEAHAEASKHFLWPVIDIGNDVNMWLRAQPESAPAWPPARGRAPAGAPRPGLWRAGPRPAPPLGAVECLGDWLRERVRERPALREYLETVSENLERAFEEGRRPLVTPLTVPPLSSFRPRCVAPTAPEPPTAAAADKILAPPAALVSAFGATPRRAAASQAEVPAASSDSESSLGDIPGPALQPPANALAEALAAALAEPDSEGEDLLGTKPLKESSTPWLDVMQKAKARARGRNKGAAEAANSSRAEGGAPGT